MQMGGNFDWIGFSIPRCAEASLRERGREGGRERERMRMNSACVGNPSPGSQSSKSGKLLSVGQ